MSDFLSPKYFFHAGVIWLLFLLIMIMPWTAGAATVDTRYPGLATGLLKHSVLAPLDKDTLLAADGFSITHSQILAARYGIRSIPVQAFYDASGTEVFRHVGFFAQTEVDKQLAAMGVK